MSPVLAVEEELWSNQELAGLDQPEAPQGELYEAEGMTVNGADESVGYSYWEVESKLRTGSLFIAKYMMCCPSKAAVAKPPTSGTSEWTREELGA